MAALTWIDQVLATPTIGINHDAWLALPVEAWPALQTLFDKFTEEKGQATVETKDPLEIRLNTESGLAMTMKAHDLVVSRNYKLRTVERPGKLPDVDLPAIVPFTSLLGDVIQLINDFAREARFGRRVHRLGIVAECHLNIEDVPPGVSRFLAHLAAPWKQSRLIAATTNLTAVLEETPRHTDRCHHAASYDLGAERKTLRMRLDWQRVFEPTPLHLGPSDLAAELNTCRDAALRYFERFGVGDFNYAASDD